MCFQEPPAAKPKAMSKARKFIVDTGQPYFRGVQKRTQANLGSRGGFHEPPEIEMPKAMTGFVDPSLITLMGGGCWVAGICSEDSGHDGKRTTSCEG